MNTDDCDCNKEPPEITFHGFFANTSQGAWIKITEYDYRTLHKQMTDCAKHAEYSTLRLLKVDPPA